MIGMLIGMFLAIPSALIAWIAIHVRRTESVKWYMKGLLQQVYVCAELDHRMGREWQWRFEAMDVEAKMVEMVDEWWRPLDSFYEDLTFTDPNASQPGVLRLVK